MSGAGQAGFRLADAIIVGYVQYSHLSSSNCDLMWRAVAACARDRDVAITVHSIVAFRQGDPVEAVSIGSGLSKYDRATYTIYNYLIVCGWKATLLSRLGRRTTIGPDGALKRARRCPTELRKTTQRYYHDND